VALVFMRLFGLYQAVVTSSARQSESVSLDVVLVQDVSISQLVINHDMQADPISGHNGLMKLPYSGNTEAVPDGDRAPGYYYRPDFPTTDYHWPPTDTLHYAITDTNKPGRENVPWEPFEQQQAAAHFFINQLDPRYDKVAVISFSDSATTLTNLTNAFTNAHIAIGYSPTTTGQIGMIGMKPTGGTAMAAGISAGIAALTNYTYARQDAVGAIILITDGSATNRLDGSRPQGCNSGNLAPCSPCRDDVMAQARLAASKGIVIYTIFVGDAVFEQNNALLLQWVADLTDNGQLDGDYSGSRDLANGGWAPAYDAIWFQTHVSENYHLASSQSGLQQAYQAILEKIYTRLLK
jgi:von Willebrand factor type A domain